MSSSPSTSLLRSTPPPNQLVGPSPQINRPSSIGRTSSFLSQSGRSFTHAQIANMYADASPPVTGAMSSEQILGGSSSPIYTPISPSSLSFTKQPILRSLSGRPPFAGPSNSSPFIPGSLERDTTTLYSPSNAPPQIIKRYSSSLSQRHGRSAGNAGGMQAVTTGSQSSGEGTSLPSSVNAPGQTISRRVSTRMSQESGLRHSLEGRAQLPIPCPDDEDIQAFLKTLDALPQPPSLAAPAVQVSRSLLPSTSSSLSVPSIPQSPSPMHALGESPGGPSARIPMTRAQVDDTLKRMAGSFNLNTGKLVESAPVSRDPSQRVPSSTASSSGPLSVGLLTASRPNSAPRRVSAAESDPSARPGFRRQTSGGSPLATRPVSAQTRSQLAVSPLNPPRSDIIKPVVVRSLPGNPAPLTEDSPLPLQSAGLTALSPQTTGGTSIATNESTSTRTSRRGPVLLRGGFGEQRPSLSPSHSPVRDLNRQRGTVDRRAEDDSGIWHRPGATRATRAGAPIFAGYGAGRKLAGQSTAPSSLGGDGESDQDGQSEERGRGREGRVTSEGGRESKARKGSLGGDW